MKAISRATIILALLTVVFMFPAIADAVSESRWVGGVYGNTELWGLNYSRPFTSSSHYILVSNESGFLARYLYEFKASILQTGTEVRFPASPVFVNISNNEVAVKSRTLSINLDNIPQLRQNDVFTLDGYTRISISARRGRDRDGWRVTQRRNYLK